MMKKRAAALCLAGALALGTCTVSAANGTRNISATFRNIKIVVDGKTLSTSAEPFIYNGTTYLPIRAVGEAVGKEVTWDGNTNTVYLGAVPAGAIQAPATPAPAATGDLPVFRAASIELGYDSADVAEHIAAMSSNLDLILDVYMSLCDYYAYEGNAQRAQALYAEAQQTALDRCTADADKVAEAKEYLADFYQDAILPRF